jgi:hypothetical protein
MKKNYNSFPVLEYKRKYAVLKSQNYKILKTPLQDNFQIELFFKDVSDSMNYCLEIMKEHLKDYMEGVFKNIDECANNSIYILLDMDKTKKLNFRMYNLMKSISVLGNIFMIKSIYYFIIIFILFRHKTNRRSKNVFK